MESQVLETIRTQPGPQRAFLSSPADIVIAGGAAGGSKTFGLLLDPLRYLSVKGFGAVIFRRTFPQIMNEGGMWDTAAEIYPQCGGIPRQSSLEWVFPGNVRIKFAHMQHEQNRYDWDGSQIPYLGFDQLEHFSWKSFFYMLSRNRTTCGVAPCIRGTCNPEPDHWLRSFMAWWINDETGLPIPERSGVVRWFVIREDVPDWADTREELIERYSPEEKPKSFTFIPSTVYDNKILLKHNPEYLANLRALPKVDRERLLSGNWNARESAGMFFQRGWFEIVEAAPSLTEEIRYWDRAATDAKAKTAGKASWTAGVRMGKNGAGVYYIKHVEHFQGTPLAVKERIRNVATQDGTSVKVGIEQDPAQAGKAEAEDQVRNLAGFNARVNRVHERKGVRAKPVSAQAEAGNIKLVRGPWNEAFLREHDNFDGSDNCMADQVDATSGAFHMLTETKKRAGVWGKR